MTREEAYHVTLDALAKVQWNVAMILEAKATEAEKVRNWLISHMTTDTYTAHSDQLAASIQFSEQNVELIDGLTKLCNGLTRNLKSILNPDGDESDMGGMASLFGGSDADGDSR